MGDDMQISLDMDGAFLTLPEDFLLKLAALNAFNRENGLRELAAREVLEVLLDKALSRLAPGGEDR